MRGIGEERRNKDGNSISGFPPSPPPWIKPSGVVSDAELTRDHPVLSFLTCQIPATCLEQIYPQAFLLSPCSSYFYHPPSLPAPAWGGAINLGDALCVFCRGFRAFCHPETGNKPQNLSKPPPPSAPRQGQRWICKAKPSPWLYYRGLASKNRAQVEREKRKGLNSS